MSSPTIDCDAVQQVYESSLGLAESIKDKLNQLTEEEYKNSTLVLTLVNKQIQLSFTTQIPEDLRATLNIQNSTYRHLRTDYEQRQRLGRRYNYYPMLILILQETMIVGYCRLQLIRANIADIESLVSGPGCSSNDGLISAVRPETNYYFDVVS